MIYITGKINHTNKLPANAKTPPILLGVDP